MQFAYKSQGFLGTLAQDQGQQRSAREAPIPENRNVLKAAAKEMAMNSSSLSSADRKKLAEATRAQVYTLARASGLEPAEIYVNGRYERELRDGITGEVFAQVLEWEDLLEFLRLLPPLGPERGGAGMNLRPNVEELTRRLARERGYGLAAPNNSTRIVITRRERDREVAVHHADFWRGALAAILKLPPVEAKPPEAGVVAAQDAPARPQRAEDAPCFLCGGASLPGDCAACDTDITNQRGPAAGSAL